jgi:DNA-binding response OmpR family regulator
VAYILLIDDDEQFRAILRQTLNQDGHRLTPVCDGEEGLRLPGEVRPDRIITERLMPNKAGMETIMALSDGGSVIPIIEFSNGVHVLSAHFKLEAAVIIAGKATLAGPFARADLRPAIEKALA